MAVGDGHSAPRMNFGLLGPLEVRCDGALMPVAAGKQRALLAALLLDGGQLVGLDQLVDVLWSDRPPPSARVTLQNHVMRLRQSLGSAGRARIATESGGYRIQVAAAELDVWRFEALLRQAREAGGAGSWLVAAQTAKAAIGLWRGEPLADVSSETLALREVPRLAELRLQALELRIDADLRCGAHDRVIGDLRKLITTHPLRERLHGLLMQALYLDGRQGEALGAYRQVRTLLVAELGTEPGAELRLLQQQILSCDPALGDSRPGAIDGSRPGAIDGSDHGRPAVPRQLPGTVRHFTGRSAELARLTGLLQRPGGSPSVVISAVGGTAGVGKTALAVHWANQVADQFPDGQLYVNLRGYDPGQPVAANDALARFLRALGLPDASIPAEPDDRAARYQSLLAGRRILVLLDNASSAAQLRPLLPLSPACAAIVTSRDTLAGLVARDGAQRLDLDLLPAADAVRLLSVLIGDRAEVDPAATTALAEYCARLPLALRVAAELAVSRPEVPLGQLVAELAGAPDRLDLLDAGGDQETAVRAVFSWSYRHLPAAAALMFRLMGLHPGPSADVYAAAALTASSAGLAARSLGTLARAHLVQLAGTDRYSLHDLLRDYARELAVAFDAEAERRAALVRLFDYYLATAAAAMDTLYPAERHRRPAVPALTDPVPSVADPASALAWLDGQRANLIAVASSAAGQGWPGYATRLSALLFRYLDAGSHYAQARTLHTCARRAAQHAGDPRAEAVTLTGLGVLDWRQGRYAESVGHHQRALTLYQETGDLAGEAASQGNLGLVEYRQGRYDQAMVHFRAALKLYRGLSNRNGEARALNSLGDVRWRRGGYAEAENYYQQALVLHRETGHRPGEADALTGLGDVGRLTGSLDRASASYQQALTVSEDSGNREGAARALTGLGAVAQRQGRYQEAAGHFGQALARYREIGNQFGETEVFNGLGELHLCEGATDRASTSYAAALAFAIRTGDTYQQARAHDGLGNCCATVDPGQAEIHWGRALSLYAGLGISPEPQ
jgi:DNA-binding SARP family transcriptional activator/tetratricopeptide (TPR) repeat protein